MNVNAALDPLTSATVSASAGTGKTWSLVSRIVRILIDGADPSGILAITFTRKAAAEMQARLNDRLLQLASCSPDELKNQLQLIDAPVTPSSMECARQLYEKLLNANYPPRIATFHSMCQELLKRFPFDANVPPGFELTEQTTDLENEARDLLFTEATKNNNGEVAEALEILFFYGNGIDNTRLALDNFLRHRSDWWAYTEHQNDPVNYATEKLTGQLQITDSQNPAENFFTPKVTTELAEFSQLLEKNPTTKNIEHSTDINKAIKQLGSSQYEDAFQLVVNVFLTTSGTPRQRKSSKKQISTMGETGDRRFLELHDLFIEKITEVLDIQAKLKTLVVSRAWFIAGHRLIQHFQTIKAEQRLLDFADLEWNAYQLLSSTDYATWIQYKLDSRIDHILIDEYQDTNPTQWHLLKPLLEEMSTTDEQHQRSVFLVGDTKQSIYRFRRAQPELFNIAQQWMNENLTCTNTSLDLSRRSAPAIIDFVNTVFKDGDLRDQIVDFEEHGTHLTNLWGRVTVVPQFKEDDATEQEHSQETGETHQDTITELRNPLTTPLLKDENLRRVNEASFIADEINRLVSAPAYTGPEESAQLITFADIIILLRQRTHAATYEKALNEKGIPYIGINKGTLLETLEIKDITALLNILVTPFDNLALAQILKSPIFGCSDQILLSLATIKHKRWFERLATLAEKNPDIPEIQRAISLLSSWKKVAGILPVHDLLDKIISESNLIQRYIAAYPPHLEPSVESNLNRFIELSLEVDSGRYPSIARFLHRLATLRDNQTDAPDELPAGKQSERVRLLTIHAAKGLEAPVIFLADTTSTPQNKEAHTAVVNWPANASKPDHFLLALRKDEQDNYVKAIFAAHNQDNQREQANLLYVALTRARQLLYITGSEPAKNKSNNSWYTAIISQLEKHSEAIEKTEDGCFIFSSHKMPEPDKPVIKPTAAGEIKVDPKLNIPLPEISAETTLTPSTISQADAEEVENILSASSSGDARLRGIIIHKILQLLTESGEPTKARKQISIFFENQTSDSLINQCWQEAHTVWSHPSFKFLFDTSSYDSAYNEVPVQYRHKHYILHGIIDRLVVSGKTVHIVDYKTGKNDARLSEEEISAKFGAQMSVYYRGIREIWPDKSVSAKVLFTHQQTIVEIEIQQLEKLIEMAEKQETTAA